GGGGGFWRGGRGGGGRGGGGGVMISKKNLPHRSELRQPRVKRQKADEVQVQDVRPVPFQNPGQISARPPIAVSRVGQHFEGHVLKIKELSHFRVWFRKKTEHTLPATFSQLHRQLARTHLRAADAPALNGEYR